MDKMMSMEMTPEMKKGMLSEAAPAEAEGPKYPYGSRITLEDDHVDGMGMGGAKAGDEMEMAGMAKVIGTRSEDQAGGKKRRSVELQITHMAMAPKKKVDVKKALYGDKGGAPAAGAGMPGGHKGM